MARVSIERSEKRLEVMLRTRRWVRCRIQVGKRTSLLSERSRVSRESKLARVSGRTRERSFEAR